MREVQPSTRASYWPQHAGGAPAGQLDREHNATSGSSPSLLVFQRPDGLSQWVPQRACRWPGKVRLAAGRVAPDLTVLRHLQLRRRRSNSTLLPRNSPPSLPNMYIPPASNFPLPLFPSNHIRARDFSPGVVIVAVMGRAPCKPWKLELFTGSSQVCTVA